MRIGLITPGFSASERDWCIPALLDLVRQLAQEHEVHVLALRYPYQRRSYRVYGATVHPCGIARASGLARLPLLSTALARLLVLVRRQRLDLLHAVWADEPGFLATRAGLLLRRPALVSLMGGELVAMAEIGYGGQLSRLNRWLTSHALRRASAVTAGSAYLQRLAQAEVAPQRLRWMPLGVDISRFTPEPPASDGFRLAGAPALLHVASLVPVKDQQLLLRAFARLASAMPGAHLHIVGQGPLQPALQQLAGQLGLAPHVSFHGLVDHGQLARFYRAADLCVLSSRYESQGMVVLEAAACGRPSAGTAVGLLPELSPAWSCVAPGDVDGLAQALRHGLQDQARLAGLGQASLELARTRYSLRQRAAALCRLYEELIAS